MCVLLCVRACGSDLGFGCMDAWVQYTMAGSAGHLVIGLQYRRLTRLSGFRLQSNKSHRNKVCRWSKIKLALLQPICLLNDDCSPLASSTQRQPSIPKEEAEPVFYSIHANRIQITLSNTGQRSPNHFTSRFLPWKDHLYRPSYTIYRYKSNDVILAKHLMRWHFTSATRVLLHKRNRHFSHTLSCFGS